MPHGSPIDIVYLWVDGNDLTWRAKRQAALIIAAAMAFPDGYIPTSGLTKRDRVKLAGNAVTPPAAEVIVAPAFAASFFGAAFAFVVFAFVTASGEYVLPRL